MVCLYFQVSAGCHTVEPSHLHLTAEVLCSIQFPFDVMKCYKYINSDTKSAKLGDHWRLFQPPEDSNVDNSLRMHVAWQKPHRGNHFWPPPLRTPWMSDVSQKRIILIFYNILAQLKFQANNFTFKSAYARVGSMNSRQQNESNRHKYRHIYSEIWKCPARKQHTGFSFRVVNDGEFFIKREIGRNNTTKLVKFSGEICPLLLLVRLATELIGPFRW